MKLLSSLFMASVCNFSSWSTSSSGPPVTQTPGFSVVEEGETVRINCCWTVDFEMMTLIWLKDGASIKSERHQRPDKYRCSDLTFRQVTRNDTGTYICKLTVEAPKYATHEGNATVITIMTRDNTNNSNTGVDTRPGASLTLLLPVIISLTALSLLLIVVLVCFRRRRAQAARVIYEVPHIDSEVADVDKNSTGSSTGSSQWCQVAVYESLDYFEHMQTKESG